MIRNQDGQVIPVYLEDASGNPVTGVVPTTGQLRVSKSGDTLVNAMGTWHETGSGYYRYMPPAVETDTDSYLVVLVTTPGVIPYPIAAFIDGGLRPESPPRARRVPIWMNNSAGAGVSFLALAGSDLQLAVNAAAFVNAAGARGASGDGLYYYENEPSDLSGTIVVLKALGAGAKTYVYTYAPGASTQPTPLSPAALAAAAAAAGQGPAPDVEVFQQRVMIVVPTAVNVCLMAAENIVDNLRVRQSADLTLPSLYKRAFLVAHETDEIAVVKS